MLYLLFHLLKSFLNYNSYHDDDVGGLDKNYYLFPLFVSANHVRQSRMRHMTRSNWSMCYLPFILKRGGVVKIGIQLKYKKIVFLIFFYICLYCVYCIFYISL